MLYEMWSLGSRPFEDTKAKDVSDILVDNRFGIMSRKPRIICALIECLYSENNYNITLDAYRIPYSLIQS